MIISSIIVTSVLVLSVLIVMGRWIRAPVSLTMHRVWLVVIVAVLILRNYWIVWWKICVWVGLVSGWRVVVVVLMVWLGVVMVGPIWNCVWVIMGIWWIVWVRV
jgi:hypothetical protein